MNIYYTQLLSQFSVFTSYLLIPSPYTAASAPLPTNDRITRTTFCVCPFRYVPAQQNDVSIQLKCILILKSIIFWGKHISWKDHHFGWNTWFPNLNLMRSLSFLFCFTKLTNPNQLLIWCIGSIRGQPQSNGFTCITKEYFHVKIVLYELVMMIWSLQRFGLESSNVEFCFFIIWKIII